MRKLRFFIVLVKPNLGILPVFDEINLGILPVFGKKNLGICIFS